QNGRKAGDRDECHLHDASDAIDPSGYRLRVPGMKQQEIDHHRSGAKWQSSDEHGESPEEFRIARMRRRGDVRSDAFGPKRCQPQRPPIRAKSPDFVAMNPGNARLGKRRAIDALAAFRTARAFDPAQVIAAFGTVEPMSFVVGRQLYWACHSRSW